MGGEVDAEEAFAKSRNGTKKKKEKRVNECC